MTAIIFVTGAFTSSLPVLFCLSQWQYSFITVWICFDMGTLYSIPISLITRSKSTSFLSNMHTLPRYSFSSLRKIQFLKNWAKHFCRGKALLPRPFDKLYMTWGRGKWPMVGVSDLGSPGELDEMCTSFRKSVYLHNLCPIWKAQLSSSFTHNNQQWQSNEISSKTVKNLLPIQFRTYYE